MARTPSMKLAAIAAIGVISLLGACASQTGTTTAARTGGAAAARAALNTPQQGTRERTPTRTAPATPAPQQDAQATTPAPSQAAPATPSTPTSFTDAQLRSFVNASRQIEPLNRQVATATGDQRTQLAGQIRAILTQNNLDGATYNAIASQAQTDQALASRIAALQSNPNG